MVPGENPTDYKYLEDYIDILKTETDIGKLLETIITIIKGQ